MTSIVPPNVIDRPSGCTVCHGDPARPIWLDYERWPATYGADGDSSSGTRCFDHFKGLGQLQWYKEFLKSHLKTGIYQHLKIPELRLREPTRGKLVGNPGSLFTAYLFHMNALRITHQLLCNTKVRGKTSELQQTLAELTAPGNEYRDSKYEKFETKFAKGMNDFNRYLKDLFLGTRQEFIDAHGPSGVMNYDEDRADFLSYTRRNAAVLATVLQGTGIDV